MKTMTRIASAALAAVLTVGATSPALAAKKTISRSKAKAIALRDAGVSEKEVRFIKAKLERDDGVRIYDIEFYDKNGMEYEYEIHAVTGKILESDIDYD